MRYRYEIHIQDPETGLWTLYEKQVPYFKPVKGWIFEHNEWRDDREIQRKEVLAIVLEANNGKPSWEIKKDTLYAKLRVVERAEDFRHWQIVWEKGDWV